MHQRQRYPKVPRQESVLYPERWLVAGADIFSSIAIERAAWSDEDFVKALHEGVGRDGKHLYPAFPYTSYTLMTRSDVLVVKGHDLRAVDLLLQAGAAPCLRTRIDNCETPREMAEKAALREIAEMLAVREARLGS